ncbi:MAG: AI-2E family transporter [Hungatella sp.]
MDLKKEDMKKIKNLIVFTVVVMALALNYQRVLVFLVYLLGVLSPFILGAAVAFVINVPMRAVETHLMRKHKNQKMRRPLSLCLTILLLLGVLGLVIFVVVPELVQSILGLQSTIPAFLLEVQRQAEILFVKYPEMVDYINEIQIDWNSTIRSIWDFLSNGAGNVLNSTLSAAKTILDGAVAFGIGLIFAIYILLQKETLGRQMKSFLRAFFPKHTTDRVLAIASLAEKTFANFLAGQCLEAMILGMMFFLTLTILRMPYAVLVGVLIAFTALIPVFGSFVGCAVGTLLMLITNPVDALTFVVIFLILQQIEGNLIYPHVVGNSVGLPSIWVLVAVTLGGNLMGVVGMLIFIPLCSVLYTLLRETVHARLSKST